MPNEDILTDKELNRGYWFVTHRPMLRRIGIGLFIALDFALIGFGIFGFIKFYVLDADRERASESQLVNVSVNPSVIQAEAPRSLSASGAQVLANKASYDFVAQVSNPNKDWYATFSYRFVAPGISTEARAGFVLPQETKYLTALAEKLTSRPAGATLELANIVWTRIDRHQIPDYGKFAADRLNVQVENALYTPNINTEGASIGKTTFTVANRTGFGYYAAKFLVVQYRGAAIAAVNTVVLDSFRPGETRNAEVTWFDELPAISKVEVIPEINILDRSAYLAP